MLGTADIDFNAVTPQSVAGWAEALLHECAHMYNEHAGRAEECGVKDAERFNWNLSGDAESNDDIVAAGCKTMAVSGILPNHLGMPDHLLAEQYMDTAGSSAFSPKSPRVSPDR